MVEHGLIKSRLLASTCHATDHFGRVANRKNLVGWANYNFCFCKIESWKFAILTDPIKLSINLYIAALVAVYSVNKYFANLLTSYFLHLWALSGAQI